MKSSEGDERAQRAVARLKQDYAAYMASLGEAVDLGDLSIPALLSELDNKKASPIVQALGLLMDRPQARTAIPALLDWAVVQSPVRPAALESLRRAVKPSFHPSSKPFSTTQKRKMTRPFEISWRWARRFPKV